jgi:ribosomal-protein-alanine N-acetyltransferase
MHVMPQLLTERLVLRAFDATDAPAVERLAGAWEVADTTLNIPHPYPTGAGAEWIATHPAAWQRRERLALAVSHRSARHDILGAISLHISEVHQHGEIGYWIGVPHWGNGYATEASCALVTFAFAQLRLHRVQARHFQRNPASGRVLQKLGMQLEGVHRDAFWRWNRFENVAVYAVLAPDWRPDGQHP